MNASQHKVRLGFGYRQGGGMAFNAAARWQDAFDVRSGVHNGRVDDYVIVDLGCDLSAYLPGQATIDLMAQNVFNQRHREYVSVPEVGRLVTTRFTVSF